MFTPLKACLEVLAEKVKCNSLMPLTKEKQALRGKAVHSSRAGSLGRKTHITVKREGTPT